MFLNFIYLAYSKINFFRLLLSFNPCIASCNHHKDKKPENPPLCCPSVATPSSIPNLSFVLSLQECYIKGFIQYKALIF